MFSLFQFGHKLLKVSKALSPAWKFCKLLLIKVVGCSRVSRNERRMFTSLSNKSCQITFGNVFQPPEYLPTICLWSLFLQAVTVISSSKTHALTLPVWATKANRIEENEVFQLTWWLFSPMQNVGVYLALKIQEQQTHNLFWQRSSSLCYLFFVNYSWISPSCFS